MRNILPIRRYPRGRVNFLSIFGGDFVFFP